MNPSIASAQVLVLMGVSGCGKSTVAALLAGRLGWPFAEGDALHPQANIDKMKAGVPLSDADRGPWLDRVADWIDARLDTGEHGVITCSALKRAYRTRLDRRGTGVRFVFLAGSREAIAARLAARHGHFMPATLLDSQFADVQEPGPDEPASRIELGLPPAAMAQQIEAQLQESGLQAAHRP